MKLKSFGLKLARGGFSGQFGQSARTEGRTNTGRKNKMWKRKSSISSLEMLRECRTLDLIATNQPEVALGFLLLWDCTEFSGTMGLAIYYCNFLLVRSGVDNIWFVDLL